MPAAPADAALPLPYDRVGCAAINRMITKHKIFCLLAGLLACCASAMAQQEKTEINRRDHEGKPHGVWYIHEAAVRGEPSRSEFGTYDHGAKSGPWYLADDKGNIIAIEQFKYNLRDGEVKYFENGQLTCVGHYKALNPNIRMDTVLVIHPVTREEKMVYVPTERGSVRHGRWRFYDEISGRLIKEQQYQVDELIESKDFTVSPSDSAFYEQRNAVLPHLSRPQYKHKQKDPVKSLIGK
jgi:hypothetical protein